jgi:type III secretion apparatus YscR/HrcR family protein
MQNTFGLIAFFTAAALAPLLVCVGTCFIKISIVLELVRNAIGLQNVPSTMTLNGIALVLSFYVMMPIGQDVHTYLVEHPIDFTDRNNLDRFSTEGLASYRAYLFKHARPALVEYFERLPQRNADASDAGAPALSLSPREADQTIRRDISIENREDISLFSLLPAYALTEIEDAFRIGFYLYLPFVVIDLVVSSVLLALGMMMMSPVSISIPIKLVLFLAMDGWTLLSQSLIDSYVGRT